MAGEWKRTPLQGNAEFRRDKERERLEEEIARLRALAARSGIAESVAFKGRVQVLADGTKLDRLKDRELFADSPRRLIPETATADLTQGFVKDNVLKAFAKMDCLEFTALGANYYTAPDFYHSLTYGGRNIVVGAKSLEAGPTLGLIIGGHLRNFDMTLPGLNALSHNVLIVTDGRHVLAIDPRTHDAWWLRASAGPYKAWEKLLHKKTICVQTKNGV